MVKKNILKLFVVLTLSFIFIGSVFAVDYKSFDVRKTTNQKMYKDASNLPLAGVNSYKDKSLSDMTNISGKALSNDYINKAKSIGDNLNSLDSKEKSIYTDLVKRINLDNSDKNIETILNEYENSNISASPKSVSSLFVSLLRAQGIPARTVLGYYSNSYDENYNWDSYNELYLVSFYKDGKWILTSPSAEINNYNLLSDEEKEESTLDKYYDISYEELSKDHVLISYPKGSTDPYYIYNNNETKMFSNFLNIKYQNKTNGKRINNSYSSNNKFSWFENSKTSKSDGYGNLVSISYSKNKGLYGNLNLKGFNSLKKVSVPHNKLTGVNITSSSVLEEITVNNNNINKLVLLGSKNLIKINSSSNPLTYATYQYTKNKKTATIKTTSGGTFSLNLQNSSHTLSANPKKGYKFLGWYNGNKRITVSKTYKFTKTNSFTYTAKFEKIKPAVKKTTKKKTRKPYIKISIKKQKLYYYNKKGKVVYSTKVVTGKLGKTRTPRGNYTVLGKARNTYLVGDDYVNFVKYWVLIDRKNQIGMHDASWRSSFGGKIYKRNGSHGCINMPYKAAKYIYKKVPIGTRIKVV